LIVGSSNAEEKLGPDQLYVAPAIDGPSRFRVSPKQIGELEVMIGAAGIAFIVI